MIRYQDIEITLEEIENLQEEWFKTKKIHGTDKPVILDHSTAQYIINGQKYHEAYLHCVHSSHDMTKWRSEIMAPAGTERYYTYRQCKDCEYEQYYSAAGKFVDYQLESKCNS